MIKKINQEARPKKPMPLAINIIKFQMYDFNFLSTEEAVLFEYLTVKACSFKHKMFYHSSDTIKNETGIKRSRLDTILKRFEKELKIVTINVKGMPKIKYFKVHFDKIFHLLRKIYRFQKLSIENRNTLTDFFKALSETNNEKYNKRKIREI